MTKTDDPRLESLLRSVLPPTTAQAPPRDLWPLLVERTEVPAGWSWLDVGMAAAAATALLVFPEWGLLLAYHL